MQVDSGLSKYSERILELMADGALNTVFTKKEFDKIKKLRRNQNTRKVSLQLLGELKMF
jgi:predicted Zn-dependent peptidase